MLNSLFPTLSHQPNRKTKKFQNFHDPKSTSQSPNLNPNTTSQKDKHKHPKPINNHTPKTQTNKPTNPKSKIKPSQKLAHGGSWQRKMATLTTHDGDGSQCCSLCRRHLEPNSDFRRWERESISISDLRRERERERERERIGRKKYIFIKKIYTWTKQHHFKLRL